MPEDYRKIVDDVYMDIYPYYTETTPAKTTPAKTTPAKTPSKKDLINLFGSNEELMNDSSDVPIGTVAKSKKTPAKTTLAKTTPSKTPAKKTPVKTTPTKTPEQKAQELKEYRKKYYQENKDKFKPKSKK